MSDVWQGPGWWLASDGKWYPPESRPESPADSATGRGVITEAPPVVDEIETTDTVLPVEEPAAAAPIETPQPAAPPQPVHTPQSVETPPAAEPPQGGWQAIEPEATPEGVDMSTEAAIPTPEVDIVEVQAEPVAPPDEGQVRGGMPRDRGEALHRHEAWRKPSDRPSAATTGAAEAPPTGTPEVVDLGVHREPAPEPAPPAPSPWRGVLLALGFLGAIIGISILVGLLLTNYVFDDDESDVSTDDTTTTTTTESSAPTSDAPTTESTAATTEDPSAGEEVSVFELSAGDCIEGDIGTGPLQRLIRVDCSVPHQFEVYREAILDPDITEFDEAEISTAAETICREALDAYIPPDDERDIRFKWFQPTAESWAQEENPDRAITCLLFDADGPLTGRAA